MPVPRILALVPLLVAGMYLPPFGPALAKPPAGVLGMSHEKFSSDDVTVKCGDTLTMENNSHWAHIIGPGQDGLLEEAAGVPVVRRALMEATDVYTTGAWDTPGTFYLTCAVHPKMNVKVVVTGCCC
jgi:plastocyanin